MSKSYNRQKSRTFSASRKKERIRSLPIRGNITSNTVTITDVISDESDLAAANDEQTTTKR
ncbi:hypothetical protein [Dubosiella newyorkensis]|uniref:hypothetical protein n=1 Tax=Dubosiella newyorkensis TaxID=1862672 RepID=UPI003F67B067